MSLIPIPSGLPAEQARPSGDQGHARPDAQDASRRAQAFDEAVAEARRAGSDSTPGSRRALGRTPLDDRRPASASSSGGGKAGAASIQKHPQASEIAAGGMPAWAPPNESPALTALHGVGVDRLGARPDGGCGVAKPREAWPDGGAAFRPSANPPLAKKDPTSEPLGLSVVRAES